MRGATQTRVTFDILLRGEWVGILTEIGLDEIETATSFVDYMHECYGESKSSVWYRLKRMKEMGLLEFMEKGEEPHPLSLTRKGVETLRSSAAGRAPVPRSIMRIAAMRVASPF